ncbi:FAD-dependent monooxygenase [Ralstonia wenshanensis]|uniref:Rifampicin monooxygenase n=1 Tax=Ralstonia wenshanensis TaxID=2842456 RepID=A0AAD2EI38_9RALS|nr:FAD-dependent monooxygenase [Ralstonia wenshanensis]CAJ0683656.1 Rifampicin monooxygenase [Ralstonia wenshanensis]
MSGHAVVIAGGGPTGLMLAAELALVGIDVAIVEHRANQDVVGVRALGLHARSVEVLDQRGVAERFFSQGKTYPVVHFGENPLDISDFPTRHNYVLGLWQHHTERILAEWVSELGVPFYREREVTGFLQDDTGVDVTLSDGEMLRAQYLVGCDGGRSAVRKAAGIAFAGWDATTSWLIAEVHTTQTPPPFGFKYDAIGRHAVAPMEDGKCVRFVLTERQLGTDNAPTLADLSEALIAVYGTDFGAHRPNWILRFSDMARQAVAYRDKRVLLAGDAAHVHPPMGGQGLNMGMQDAVNLGWKLAAVINRTAPDSLLDSYHAERHPVAARTLRNTLAQVVLLRQDERSKALSEITSELFRMDEPRRHLVGMVSALDVRYDFGEGHPLLGRRMPDLDLETAEGTVRVFHLLHGAGAVLINFGPADATDIAPWADRVRRVDARYAGTWSLPVVGTVPAPAAVLIRPDGHVAWVGDGTTAGLQAALHRWFGAATA